MFEKCRSIEIRKPITILMNQRLLLKESVGVSTKTEISHVLDIDHVFQDRVEITLLRELIVAEVHTVTWLIS